MVDAFHEAWTLLKATYGPMTEKETVDARYRELGPQNWMSSFTNKDGTPTKRRWPGTPTWDKSRSIMDEYNLTGVRRTPMGTEGSMTDEDAEFLDMFREEQPAPRREQPKSDAEKHGMTDAAYLEWQRRLDTIRRRDAMSPKPKPMQMESPFQQANQGGQPDTTPPMSEWPYGNPKIWDRGGSAAPN